MKFSKLLIVTISYLILLAVVYYAHIVYFRVDVVLYSGIFDALLAGMVIVLFLNYGQGFDILNPFEKLQLLVICLLVGYVVVLSVPTVLDRSLSFYILEKVDQRGGGILLSGFEEIFTKEYSKDHRLVDLRLTEQLKSGTIKIENGCVKLTQRGEALAAFSRFFRQNLLPKQRLLMGQYTDTLTHPFDKNNLSMGYKCD